MARTDRSVLSMMSPLKMQVLLCARNSRRPTLTTATYAVQATGLFTSSMLSIHTATGSAINHSIHRKMNSCNTCMNFIVHLRRSCFRVALSLSKIFPEIKAPHSSLSSWTKSCKAAELGTSARSYLIQLSRKIR